MNALRSDEAAARSPGSGDGGLDLQRLRQLLLLQQVPERLGNRQNERLLPQMLTSELLPFQPALPLQLLQPVPPSSQLLLAAMDQQLRDAANVQYLREFAAAAVAAEERVLTDFLAKRILQQRQQVLMAPQPPVPQVPVVASTDERATSTSALKTVPSERRSLPLLQDCKTPLEAAQTLHILGTTLRSKSDPYVDSASIPDPAVSVAGSSRHCFPSRLYRMLVEVEEQGLSDVVSFLPHGRSFLVHKQERFVKEFLPRYFGGQTKWSSFSRQLNLYGFLRVTSGQDVGAYYHELFLLGRPKLIRYMKRVGAPHGLDRRRYKLPDGDDPDFYAMKPFEPEVADTAGVVKR